jgi:WD40 repeat protein
MSPLLAPARPCQPYPGLRPFLLEEADIYFGREEQVQQILERLNRGRFLALVGTSGCGKSSLARAGLIAALEAGFMIKAGARWRAATMRPGNHPLNNLADALLKPGVLGADPPPCDTRAVPPEGASQEVKPFLLATLRRGPRGLADFLKEPLTAGAGPALPESENLLLLVDQFEEIFRFWREGDRNEAEAFVALLLETARQETPSVYVVLTMRSDYLGDCAIFNGLPEALNDSQFLTPRLTRPQRRKAIEGPARVCGGKVEPALVGRLLNDMGAEPDQLPLMQHALMRLWSLACPAACAAPGAPRGEVVLRLEEYERLGKLTEALDQHAEEVHEKGLTPEQRPLAEALFRCLSERDLSAGADRQRDTRRPCRLKEVAAVAGVPAEKVAAVADVFRATGVNFLTPPPEVPLTPETVLDVTHESLLRRWKRLRRWVEAEATSADTYRRLQDDAREWAAGRAGLMERLKLSHTREWMKREHPTAAWARRYGGDFDLALRFLEESERAEKAQAVEREREKRSKRVVRITIAALGLAAVVLSLLVGLLYWRAQAAEAEEKNRDMEREREQEKKALQSARERAHYAAFYTLTSKGQSSLPAKPIVGVLYGTVADQLASSEWGVGSEMSSIARHFLYKVLASIGGTGYGAGQGAITQVAVSEDRGSGRPRWLASSGQDGTITLWDLGKKELGATPLHLIGYQGRVQQFRFVRQGGKTPWLIALSSTERTYLVTLWKLDDPQVACKVAHGFENLHVSRDENWLLTYDRGHARLFDLRGTDPTANPVEVTSKARPFNVRATSFSREGNWLAVITHEGDALVCDLGAAKGSRRVSALKLRVAKGAKPQSLRGRQVKSGGFTDDGRKLVVYFSDGRARVWKRTGARWDEPGTEERLRTPFKDGEEVRVVTDSRGLRAVVARRPVLEASDPTQPDLSAPAGAGPTAYLFDGNDLDSRVALGGFDDSVDWSRSFQVDEQMGRLAAASKRPGDGVQVWDLGSATPDVPLRPVTARPPNPVLSWGMASDGHWLVTRGPENLVRLWDLFSRGPLPAPADLRGHDGDVTAFAFSEANRWLVTGGADGTLRTWGLTDVRPSAEPLVLRSAGAPRTVLIAPGKRWFARAGIDTVHLWVLSRGDDPFPLRLPAVQKCGPPTLRASRDGRWLSAIFPHETDFSAMLWDTKAEKEPAERGRLGKVQGEIARLDVSREGEWAAATVKDSNSPSVRLWRLQAAGGTGPGGSVAPPTDWSAKGQLWGFAVGGKALLTNTAGSFQLWKLGEPIQEIPLGADRCHQAVLTPDENYLIVRPASGPARLIDLRKAIAEMKPAARNITGWPESGRSRIYLSANGRWLFAVPQDRALLCWDLGSPESDIAPIAYKAIREDEAEAGARDDDLAPDELPDSRMSYLSPDRRWLVTHADGAPHLWDLESEPQKQRPGPTRWPLPKQLSNAVFSPDSAWLVATDKDGLQLYPLPRPGNGANPLEKPKAEIPGKFSQGQVRAAAASRDGSWLAVADQNSAIRVWSTVGGAQPVVLTNAVALSSPTLFISLDGRQVFAVDAPHSTIQISGATPEGLLKSAEQVFGRNLSREEWKQLGMPPPYRLIFPSLPEPQPGLDLDPSGQPHALGSPIAELPLVRGAGQVRQRLARDDPKDSQFRKHPCKVYTVQLEKGRVYQIDLRSKTFDAYLRLEGADRKELARDDDGGGGLNARIVFHCRETGTYRIIATSFDGRVGDFALTVQSQ